MNRNARATKRFLKEIDDLLAETKAALDEMTASAGAPDRDALVRVRHNVSTIAELSAWVIHRARDTKAAA